MIRCKEEDCAATHLARGDFETAKMDGHFRKRDLGLLGGGEKTQHKLGRLLKQFGGKGGGDGAGKDPPVPVHRQRADGEPVHIGTGLGK